MKVQELIDELSKLPRDAEVEAWSVVVDDWSSIDKVYYDPEDANLHGAVRLR